MWLSFNPRFNKVIWKQIINYLRWSLWGQNYINMFFINFNGHAWVISGGLYQTVDGEIGSLIKI